METPWYECEECSAVATHRYECNHNGRRTYLCAICAQKAAQEDAAEDGDENWENIAPVNTDLYLCCYETEHGKKYWRLTGEPDETAAIVAGPATMGADGYTTEEDAASNLADTISVSLNAHRTDPGWIRV